MNKKKYLALLLTSGVAVGLVAILPAFASAQTVSTQTPTQTGAQSGSGGHFGGANGPRMAPGVFGTVTAVSGTTLTVSAKSRPMPNGTSTTASSATATTITYTVDASNAKVLKNGTSSTVSSIATGDMVMVQGTVSGTNVTATTIIDGMGGMRGGKGGFTGGQHSTSTPPTSPIKGNGEPVVGGNITAISGTTLTVTNASNVTYTIDASDATIVKNGTSTAASDLAVGDSVVVQGTVNGNSVTASSVLDQGVQQATGTATSTAHSGGAGAGFFGAIGSFFQHLFGF